MKNLLYTVTCILLTTLPSFSQGPYNMPDNIGSGNCLEFDGVDDYVDCGDIHSNTFDGINSLLTIEGWILPNTAAGHHAIVVKYNSSITPNRRTIYFAVRDGGFLNFTAHNQTPSGFIDGITDIRNIISGQWYHVSAVVNLQTQIILLYVNGTLQASTTSTTGTTPTSFLDNAIPVELGASVGGGGRGHFWDGQIDEVRIWNVARTQAQIRDNMCRQLTGAETGLVGYWNMNEGTGNTVNDLTTNNNHGTRQ